MGTGNSFRHECLGDAELLELLAESGALSGSDGSHVADCPSCSQRLRELIRLREIAAAALAGLVPAKLDGCPEWQVLAAYSESSAPADDALSRHVQSCETCMLQVARLRIESYRASRELPVLQEPVPVVLAGSRLRPYVFSPFRVWMPVVGTLAALLVLVVWLNRDPEAPVVSARKPVTVKAPAAPISPSIPSRSIPDTASARNPVMRGPFMAPPPATDEAPLLYRSIPGSSIASILFGYLSNGSQPRIVALPSSEKLTLHNGDRFFLRLAAKSRAWVYIFQDDPKGTTEVLFPNQEFSLVSNPVTGTTFNKVPAEGYLGLDETLGTETIYVFYSDAPIERCERLLRLAPDSTVSPEVRQILHGLVQASDGADASVPHFSAIRYSFSHER